MEDNETDIIELERVSLFGSSMSMLVPKILIDAGEFRQIPDNQEVWISQASNDDSCMIIELVEYDNDPTHDASYHFDQLVIDNEAKSMNILWKDTRFEFPVPDSFPRDITTYETLIGTQSIMKFRSLEHLDNVYIYLAMFNMPIHGTTVLITYHQFPPISSGMYNIFLKCAFSIELHDSSLFHPE